MVQRPQCAVGHPVVVALDAVWLEIHAGDPIAEVVGDGGGCRPPGHPTHCPPRFASIGSSAAASPPGDLVHAPRPVAGAWTGSPLATTTISVVAIVGRVFLEAIDRSSADGAGAGNMRRGFPVRTAIARQNDAGFGDCPTCQRVGLGVVLATEGVRRSITPVGGPFGQRRS